MKEPTDAGEAASGPKQVLQSTDEDEAEKKTEEGNEELPDCEGAEDAAEDEAEANQAALLSVGRRANNRLLCRSGPNLRQLATSSNECLACNHAERLFGRQHGPVG